jgi:hypothetical protein
MLSESDKLLISPKFSKPHVTIQHYCHLNYWMVTIRCKDRNKLFFDTVCTLSDLNYDVYHGAIDQVRGVFGLAGLAAHKPAAVLCARNEGCITWWQSGAQDAQPAQYSRTGAGQTVTQSAAVVYAILPWLCGCVLTLCSTAGG